MKLESWNAAKCAPYLPRPKRSDHKYRRGVLGCVTGSKQYPGAALLTTAAALSVGIGMVRYFGPESVKKAVIQNRPEVVIQTGNIDAYVLGSGIPARKSLLRKFTMEMANRADLPKVLDAGALYLTGASKSPTIITPHAGELAADTDSYVFFQLQANQNLCESALLKMCQRTKADVRKSTQWVDDYYNNLKNKALTGNYSKSIQELVISPEWPT